MIYKTTYQFCIFILITGMSLMYWKTTAITHQQQTKDQYTIQLLEKYNKQLTNQVEWRYQYLCEGIKKFPEYKKLKIHHDSMTLIVDKHLKAIELTPVNSKTDLNKSTRQFNKAIKNHINQLAKYRNLGIKPKEIELLFEHQLSTTIGVSNIKIFTNEKSNTIQKLTLKNDMLTYLNVISKYICSKVGHTAMVFYRRDIVSRPKQPVINLGDQFETGVFVTETQTFPSRIQEVEVNGKPLKSREFKETPTVRGQHQYNVEIKFRTHRTGRVETLKRTFSYYVK